jgi:hypothetical protein
MLRHCIVSILFLLSVHTSALAYECLFCTSSDNYIRELLNQEKTKEAFLQNENSGNHVTLDYDSRQKVDNCLQEHQCASHTDDARKGNCERGCFCEKILCAEARRVNRDHCVERCQKYWLHYLLTEQQKKNKTKP